MTAHEQTMLALVILLITLAAIGVLAVGYLLVQRAYARGYDRGQDDGYDMGHADGYGECEMGDAA